jgi:hypothetical protein
MSNSHRRKKAQEDLPPSSPPPSSREPSQPRPSTAHLIIPVPYSPRRPRSDSIDSLLDSMFQPDSNYDNSRCASDREPSPLPTLPSATYVKGADTTTSTEASGWEALRAARLAIEEWVQLYGPISSWARKFREGYGIACQADGNTQTAVDLFLASVHEQVNIGRRILGELNSSPIIRPPVSSDAWADWLLAGDMLGILHQGIAVLQAHLDILAPRCPVLSDSMSSIRQCAGFESSLQRDSLG